jgi:hypothetical protein
MPAAAPAMLYPMDADADKLPGQTKPFVLRILVTSYGQHGA